MKDFPIAVYQSYPIAVRQLRVELESCEKKIKQAEAEGKQGSDETNLLFMEVLTRKERLKTLSAIPYEIIADVGGKHKKALQDMFNRLDGFTWVARFGWIGQSKTPTREEIHPFMIASLLYDGLQVDKVKAGKAEVMVVTAVQMTSFGAQGVLDASIGQLENMNSLSMNLNLLSGQLPRTLRCLSQLTNLDLSANSLSGTLEASTLETMTQLVSLNLACNNLSGSLPDVFDKLSSLERLDLSCNAFSGALPASLGTLARLQELKLFNNQLVGDIPVAFASLLNLKHANLAQNRLTGGLAVFSKCSRLEKLLLQRNGFNEALDPSIKLLKRLRMLYLQHNRLQGQIPAEICQLTRLEHLNLSSNQLRGCIPDQIGQLKGLESLLLHGNLILGPVPLSIKELSKLRDFYVFRPYPAEFSMPHRAFSKLCFDRVYVMGPAAGINSMHWQHKEIYGRDKQPLDEQSVTLFSGLL